MNSKIIIILGTAVLLAGCSSSESTSSENAQKNYDHYTRGNFETMQACLDFIGDEASRNGMQMQTSSDKPDKVTGSFNGDSAMFYYCERQETGTSGTYYEAAYPKFK